MFNIPPDIFNRFQAANQMPNSGTYTATGRPYVGPFSNNTDTPFRTIDPAKPGGFQPAYNQGLNASAAQLYDHLRARPGQAPWSHGLYGAGAVRDIGYVAPTTDMDNMEGSSGDLSSYLPTVVPNFDLAQMPNIFNRGMRF